MSFLSKLRTGAEPKFHDLHRIPSRDDLNDKENLANSGRGINLFAAKSLSPTLKAGSFRENESGRVSLKQPIRQPLQRMSSLSSHKNKSDNTNAGGVKDNRFASNRSVTATVVPNNPAPSATNAPSASLDSWYDQAMFGSVEPEDDVSTVISEGTVQTFQSHHLPTPMVANPAHEPFSTFTAPSEHHHPSPPSSARTIQSQVSAAAPSGLGDYQYRSFVQSRVPAMSSSASFHSGIALSHKIDSHSLGEKPYSGHSASFHTYYDAENENVQPSSSYHYGEDRSYYEKPYTYAQEPEPSAYVDDLADEDYPSSAAQIDQEFIDSVFSKARHDRQDFVLDMLRQGRVNVNHRDQHGNTLLHICAQNNHRTLASKIIRFAGGIANVDIHAKNKKKCTPLDYCEKYGHVKFRMWLVSLETAAHDGHDIDQHPQHNHYGREQFSSRR